MKDNIFCGVVIKMCKNPMFRVARGKCVCDKILFRIAYTQQFIYHITPFTISGVTRGFFPGRAN